MPDYHPADLGPTFRFVAGNVAVPADATRFAFDLVGSGKKLNQLGNIIAVFMDQKFDIQMVMDQAVKNGIAVLLFNVQTADATLQDDHQAATALSLGKPQANPDFSGMGAFAADPTRPASVLSGSLASGQFSSANPATTTHQVSTTLYLPFFRPDDAIPFPLNGAHISFTASPGGLMKGEIHGSIRRTDIEADVFPGLARSLTKTIQADPNSAHAGTIRDTFDVGGCVNPDGTGAAAKDDKIDPCELANNPVIHALFEPDIQVFASDGVTYMPNPDTKNAKKDSVSFGIGFTAVGARF